MKEFIPDYRHAVNAAYNIEAQRLPLYDHVVADNVMEAILNKEFAHLLEGDEKDVKEYFRIFCNFFKTVGYDIVPFECGIGAIMPGSGALADPRVDPPIKTREDFENYPWDEIPDYFFTAYTNRYKALREAMPDGMRAVGGLGLGIFECVQDVVGFMNLCYIQEDDPELFADLFNKVGETNLKIWKRFLPQFADVYCILRFGDDLGFKTSTLLDTSSVRENILPQYVPIIKEIHSYRKPFLLHTCGYTYNVMDDIIATGINAKHSNEDQIATFPDWVRRYGDRIGNFGGIDTDAVCQLSKPEMKEYIHDLLDQCKGHGGIAFGTGNSVPYFMPPENYLNMLEIAREYRGDTRE